ncbi:MAG: ABC transporter permease [Deltaproteobacteria bacterium]|nr:ABC transporter permease [Deltaproteobacteria bacterium]
MSPLTEIRHVATRELTKSFRSAKGIVLLVLSLLGGTGATLLIVKAQQLKREKLAALDPSHLKDLREEAATQIFGDPATGKSLAEAPEVLIAVLLLTVWLTPLVISLLAFDSVSGDMQHKAVRYWTLRTRRSSYFIGKWAGVFASVSALTFAMHAIIWILCIVRGEAAAGTALGWGLRFWLVTLPISAVWCGLSTFVSSLFKSPIISLLVTFASFFVLWLLWMIGQVTHADALMYVYPNFYDALLVHPQINKAMTGLAACLGMVGLYVGAGSFLFMKRDV